MDFLSKLRAIDAQKYSDPTDAIHKLKKRADQILAKMPSEQIPFDALEIQNFILSFRDDYNRDQMDRYIAKLCEHGGWEWDYLPNDDRHESAMRELLENWPCEADARPENTTCDYLDDLEVLEEITLSGYPFKHYDGDSGSDDRFFAERYALLALVKLAEATDFITWHGATCNREYAVLASNLRIEAAECICIAEQSIRDEQARMWKSEQQSDNIAKDPTEESSPTLATHFSKMGRKGAVRRHAEMRRLRAWAEDFYLSRAWPSANKAAHELKEIVMEYGRTIGEGAILSDSNAQRTIATWFNHALKTPV